MAKQRIIEGAILEISIENQYYVYAQILTKGLGYAFFDYKTNDKLIDFPILEQSKILFILTVYDSVITQGEWQKVGKLKIRDELKTLPMEYIQDTINPERFDLYNPNTGEILKATMEQCEGLECAAVWAANHVEQRIIDHYLGVPNITLQKLAITPHITD
jgi:hypothetical protein